MLEGHARKVAGHIRRQATNARLDNTRRKPADEAANYLTNKAPFLDYLTALQQGWPIATGIIEGACRASRQGPDGYHRRPAGDSPAPKRS